ncbi:hypothetical protein [Umezakia ovalisporum]|uniref:hypothetical protein n=1 Tax=Umezakia ovalisporum TaxID=75695 RepID=UPI0035BB31E8
MAKAIQGFHSGFSHKLPTSPCLRPEALARFPVSDAGRNQHLVHLGKSRTKI